ncbi:MAG: urease accessory protein UreD [Burkholderiaceae bacterium]|nr:urease accessory protein UreD [Burkholderiaceae bacterium]
MHPGDQRHWSNDSDSSGPSAVESTLASWTARLALDFNLDPHQTTLKTRLNHQHLGPLRIQKVLYPEGSSPCHAIIVHPPGGIAGGDRLEVLVNSQQGTHGLVTTPSAAKWYGANASLEASQLIDIDLQGAFEWLPQETIVFNRARVRSDLDIRVGEHGAMLGWDHLIFGRHASGESFAEGHFRQSLKIQIDEQLIWHDRLALVGDDALFASPIGLRGHYSCATLWAILPASKTFTEVTVQALREHSTQLAWTILHPRLLVVRLLAEPREIKFLLQDAWAQLRPLVLGLPAVAPRLWAT